MKETQPLAKVSKLADKQISLTSPFHEKETSHLQKVANIHQSQRIIGIFPNIVDAEEDLYAPGAILNMGKGNFSLVAYRTNAPAESKEPLRPLPFIKVF